MSPALLDRLLREPGAVARACADDDGPAIAATCLGAIIAGGAIFGAVVGSLRGGPQIAFAAVKVPLALLAALSLCAPAFTALAAAFGRPLPLRAVISLVLVAGARASLVLVATAPPLWLVIDLGAPYHAVKLAATLAYGLAGLAGLRALLAGLGHGAGLGPTVAAFVVLFAVVGGQSAWVLRPYLGDPRDPVVTFLVERKEGGLVHQLGHSVRSVLEAPRR